MVGEFGDHQAGPGAEMQRADHLWALCGQIQEGVPVQRDPVQAVVLLVAFGLGVAISRVSTRDLESARDPGPDGPDRCTSKATAAGRNIGQPTDSRRRPKIR
jgi:hypothetical protein